MPKKKTSTAAPKADIDFKFFRQETEGDDVRVMEGHEIGDPKPNRSGSFNLDYDLCIPFPEGRITEVFGDEGTCKTTLTLEVAGQAISKGKKVLFVNMEKNLNLSLMRTVRSLRPYLDDAIEAMKNGKEVDCPLWIVNARTGEQGLEIMRKFCTMCPEGVAILDSIDAAQPEAVLVGEIGENKVGNLAKLMSDAMRKLIDASEKNRVALVFVNQIREKITMYGDPADTPGGRAMKFYASQRIKLQKPGKAQMLVDQDGERIGVEIRYKVVKNKVAPDGNEGSFLVLFKNGVFREMELIQQCCNFGVLRMGGKGGKQVYLPKINRETGEFIEEKGELVASCMSQFQAARRLLMDETLTAKLTEMLNEAFSPESVDPMDSLIDEVQDAE